VCVDKKFFGDSYDLVKRFWAENLSSIAPIYFDKRFVPEEIRKDYTQITKLPVFNSSVAPPFAIFLDPCTGIPSPARGTRKPTKKHAPLLFIIDVFEKFHPKFLIRFDQGFGFNENKESRMKEKMNVLTTNGLCAFYYTSHANFLFVAESAAATNSLRKLLLDLGIPDWRLKSGK
jgi:hypothetical protein